MTPTSFPDYVGGTTSSEQIELIDRGTAIVNDNPAVLAEIVLRDLFCRAHLNNITACVQPILTYDQKAIDFLLYTNPCRYFRHLDNHAKWIPVDFPKYIFSGIMNSIKVSECPSIRSVHCYLSFLASQ